MKKLIPFAVMVVVVVVVVIVVVVVVVVVVVHSKVDGMGMATALFLGC